ncbi:alpha/beta hydrolase [Gracilibacillus thailandensis]|uniref:Alpha/beta hydrolase fold domain-containing protein n=1 Tax=Gracilibacillus thailandensis TaxID=563735 RepID=A0A6N7QZQ4_9BACI|nr:alpha/beta hydrolase [Gracilibacillus thailandensis]MRI67558.1 alpha/beta hydrolase fold domain-containing protein [Gracilibacillus thailandensis]
MLKSQILLSYMGAFALCILTILNLFLINAQTYIGITLILLYLLVLVSLGVHYKKQRLKVNPYTKLLLILAIFAIISELIWVRDQIYGFAILSNLLHLITFLFMFAFGLKSSFYLKPFKFRSILGKWKMILVTLITTLATVIVVVMLINQISPRPLVSILQASKGITNSYNAEESTETVLDDGSIYINDIRYDDKYPNSYLDFYQTVHNPDTAPTFILIHGGGYIWGDKTGDGQNGDDSGMIAYIQQVLDRGYNVIALNYTFAPEYNYPIPLKQVSAAVSFLKQNVETYDLNMNNIVIAGQSAGAQIAGQFVNIQIDPTYADEMEIQPVLSASDIKAVVFNSGLYDPSRFDETDSVISDYRFNTMGRAYFNVNTLEGNKDVEQSNVIKHVTKDFPPTFMSDGNTKTFNNQAKDLKAKFTTLGVKHQLNIYSKHVMELPHGFEKKRNKYAKENLNMQMDFVDAVVKQ